VRDQEEIQIKVETLEGLMSDKFLALDDEQKEKLQDRVDNLNWVLEKEKDDPSVPPSHPVAPRPKKKKKIKKPKKPEKKDTKKMGRKTIEKPKGVKYDIGDTVKMSQDGIDHSYKPFDKAVVTAFTKAGEVKVLREGTKTAITYRNTFVELINPNKPTEPGGSETFDSEDDTTAIDDEVFD